MNPVGLKYNKLTIIKETNQRYKDGTKIYLCRCDCGKTKTALLRRLKTGAVKSCGNFLCKTIYTEWIGKKQGMLTVTGIKKNKYNYFFETICDCGNYSKLLIDNFIFNGVKSCGCVRVRDAQITKGFETNPLTSMEKELLRIYKQNAKKRRLSFELDTKDFLNLLHNPCHYCGQTDFNAFTKYNLIYKYNGIDRKDNNKGYSIENCLTACGICNRAKHNMPYETFVNWIFNLKACAL